MVTYLRSILAEGSLKSYPCVFVYKSPSSIYGFSHFYFSIYRLADDAYCLYGYGGASTHFRFVDNHIFSNGWGLAILSFELYRYIVTFFSSDFFLPEQFSYFGKIGLDAVFSDSSLFLISSKPIFC